MKFIVIFEVIFSLYIIYCWKISKNKLGYFSLFEKKTFLSNWIWSISIIVLVFSVILFFKITTQSSIIETIFLVFIGVTFWESILHFKKNKKFSFDVFIEVFPGERLEQVFGAGEIKLGTYESIARVDRDAVQKIGLQISMEYPDLTETKTLYFTKL